jgi:type II secretory pathway pseudopilin PulG
VEGEMQVRRRTAQVAYRHGAGVTIIELMVAMAVMMVLIMMAIPSVVEWNDNQRLKGVVHDAADLFHQARAESIRTGRNHVVFFGNPGVLDPSNNPVQVAGSWVPVLLIDDGPPATANCAIDAGEAARWIDAVPVNNVTWGAARATTAVPTDEGTAAFDYANPAWDGATFADSAGTKINWVMFRPDGIPVVFSGAVGSCGTVGSVGRGGGALYITNGKRDYGAVLSPLGVARVHGFDGSQWTD